MSGNSRVTLNVGGYKVEVSVATLRKFPDSLLGQMFSSDESRPESDENGEYFFDRYGSLSSCFLLLLLKRVSVMVDILKSLWTFTGVV